MQFHEAVQRGRVSTDIALAIFDALDPVEPDFMIGRWHGAEFPTGHDMDGLLSQYRWYGKEFMNADQVHPLLFVGADGVPYPVNPVLMPITLARRLPDALNAVAGRIFPYGRLLFRTRQTGARLRQVAYRGKVSAAMIYDRQPIQDIFRRVDRNTVLGVMDCKGMEQPYFFVLRRDAA